MSIDSNDIAVSYTTGASDISATSTEAVAWGNPTGEPWTIKSASYTQDAAITGDNSNYYRVEVHKTTSAGVHTDLAAGGTFTSGNDVVAYVPYSLTVSTTAANQIVDSGEGLNVLLTEVGGVNTTLSALGIVDIVLTKGTAAGQ